MNLDDLCTNVYSNEEVKLPIAGQAHPLIIPTGCKVMKALSKITKAFGLNQENFEDFRIKHSMVLNQKKFRGTMCISIHPLDYMTMSDNDCNWDSCMSWQKPGEYRIGTVEMMNSPTVIVAYLKAEKDMKLFPYGEEITWNNKRWRELFVVNPAIILKVKGYPYNDKGLEQVVFDWVLELFAKNRPDRTFQEEPIELEDCSGVDYQGKRIFLSPYYGLMYNDLYRNKAYISDDFVEEWCVHKKYGELDDLYRFEVNVSGETECLVCGEETTEIDDFDCGSLMCPKCSGTIKCPECGCYVNEDDLYYLGDGDYCCRSCFEYYGAMCDCCEESYMRRDLTLVHMRHLGEMEEDFILICRDCQDSDYVADNLGPIEYMRRSYDSQRTMRSHQVDTRYMTKEGFALFGFDIDDIERLRAEAASYIEPEES